MNLPTIQEHKDLQQAVDARALYQSLGLDASNWSRWAAKNIAENPFAAQGLDFVGFVMMTNGNQTSNYLLSLDFAKKLAMQVRTEMGERIRDYFLDCERKVSQSAPVMPALPQSFSEALLLAGTLQQQIEQDAPKVAHYDAVVDRHTLLNATQVAQSVGLKSPQSLNNRLNKVGVYNKKVKRGKAFKAWFVEQGLGEMKQGNTGHVQPLFTTKGQVWVFELLSNEVA